MHHRPHDDSSTIENLRSRHLFAPEVNGMFLGFLTIEDRNPWDHDLSAGGMSIWLRYLGPASENVVT
jgi:hypothetical protein